VIEGILAGMRTSILLSLGLVSFLSSGAAEAPVQPDAPSGAAAARDAELAKLAGPIVDAFSNTEAVLSPDGKLLAFVSTRDGLPQIYVSDAAKPASPARRLVAWPERMAGISFTQDGKAIVFRSDKGADELWSFYRVPVGGGAPVELTPGERLNRDNAFVPDGSPGRLVFSARKMSEPMSTIYVASQGAPGAGKAIYRDDQPTFLTAVRRDGKEGLVIRYPTRSENHVLGIDLETGATRQIYPKSGQVTVFDAELSADGKRVFVATDGGTEQTLLLALDASTGSELARYVETKPATATILDVAVSKRGDLVALSLAAGNHGEIRLLDARTLAPKVAVAMPLGFGAAGEFSADGRALVAVWSTPTTPIDLYRIDAATGAVSPLRSEKRAALDRLPEIETRIVEIDSFDGGKIPIHVYLPKTAPGKKLPVIVSYHGGPSGNSAVKWSPYAVFYASQGYAWVEPNVRGSSGFGRAFEAGDNGPKRLDAFRDVETAGRWAAAQPWADRERVVVFGGSYGGYTVLIALTRQADLWRAGIDAFGVASLKSFMATTSGVIRRIFLLEFGDPDKDGDFLDSISPLRDAGKIVDPLFVYAGANDPRVPRSESDMIVKALRERSVPVEYMVRDDEGHSLARRETQIEFLSRSARFLEAHLR
jgi:dipeptidyl aminopeptidase/acylaminoacyl peptidase